MVEVSLLKIVSLKPHTLSLKTMNLVCVLRVVLEDGALPVPRQHHLVAFVLADMHPFVAPSACQQTTCNAGQEFVASPPVAAEKHLG